MARLADLLPLPQLHLPYLFTHRARTADVETLAARPRTPQLAGGPPMSRRRHEAPGGADGAGHGLRELVTGRRIVICAGPGGVGKTTTAAAIALQGARLGRRACVVTIDPAKRLADALGLDGADQRAPPGRRRLGPPRRAVGADARHQDHLRRRRGPQRRIASSRPRPSSTTACTATSRAPSAAPRSTWRWRSCTSCTRTAASTWSWSTPPRPATPWTSSTRPAG